MLHCGTFVDHRCTNRIITFDGFEIPRVENVNAKFRVVEAKRSARYSDGNCFATTVVDGGWQASSGGSMARYRPRLAARSALCGSAGCALVNIVEGCQRGSAVGSGEPA